MRRVPTILATALACALAGGCGGGESDAQNSDGTTDVTLTLNWVPYGEHAPFYYGVSEGIFEDAGINLKIRPGNGSATTVQQVAQQQTDFGWADTPALTNGASTGMPVTSLGVYLQKGPASLEFFESQNIDEPSDLEGKTIAATPGDAMYATFPGWLEQNGLSKDDINLVNVDPSGKIATLAEGKADVILGFFHDQAPTIESMTGKEVETLLYADYGMNLLGTGLIANNQTIAEDPDLVDTFVQATRKSWEAAAEDPDAAVKAMEENAGETPPVEVLKEQMELTIPLLNLDSGSPGANTEEQWQETIDLLAEADMLEDPGTPEDYWTPSFSEEG
jgi:NitT/TauT family transport system substrate-binding protein